VDTQETLHGNILRNISLLQLDRAFQSQMVRIETPYYENPEDVISVSASSAEFAWVDGQKDLTISFIIDENVITMTTPEGEVPFRLPGTDPEFRPVQAGGTTVGAVLVCVSEKHEEETFFLRLSPKRIPLL
jgi:hypothetical protein